MPQPDLSHAQKHGPKYFIAGALGVLITVLQMFGTLSPIICTFTKSPDMCKQIGISATVAAQELGKIQLDDGTSLTLETVDGGDQ